jgi:hypothetical protein
MYVKRIRMDGRRIHKIKRLILLKEKCMLIVVNDNLMHSFLMYLFHASTRFEQQVLIIRRANLY